MTLLQILEQFGQIVIGLFNGRVRFNYDNLAAVMKPGHPGDILDSLIGPMVNDCLLLEESNIPLEEIKELYINLDGFRETFKIKEMSAPMKNLHEFIKAEETKA